MFRGRRGSVGVGAGIVVVGLEFVRRRLEVRERSFFYLFSKYCVFI